MKITATQLRTIIKEEITKALNENDKDSSWDMKPYVDHKDWQKSIHEILSAIEGEAKKFEKEYDATARYHELQQVLYVIRDALYQSKEMGPLMRAARTMGL